MLEILKRSVAAFEAGRWDDLRASVADDVVYDELATQRRVQGADQLLGILQGWRRAFPDITCTVLRGFESGDTAIIEVEWQGTHGGPLDTQYGTLPATNTRTKVQAVIVARFENDRIVEERHYFDALGMMTALGFGPSRGIEQPAAGAQPGAAPH